MENYPIIIQKAPKEVYMRKMVSRAVIMHLPSHFIKCGQNVFTTCGHFVLFGMCISVSFLIFRNLDLHLRDTAIENVAILRFFVGRDRQRFATENNS